MTDSSFLMRLRKITFKRHGTANRSGSAIRRKGLNQNLSAGSEKIDGKVRMVMRREWTKGRAGIRAGTAFN
jgi:hypothetical protein